MSNRLRLSLPCRILQVFGLASTSTFAAFLSPTASQLQRARACRGFILTYRCGEVSDLYQGPFYSLRKLRELTPAAVYLGTRYLSTGMFWVKE
jgi:hypothetical protein